MAALVAGLVALLAPTAHAQGPQCQVVEQVVETAEGNPFGREDAPALADAIATALNQAIVRTRGVYITVSNELFEAYRSDLVGELSYSLDLTEQITSRFAGFVTGYVVERQRVIEPGWVEVTVRVDVCLDLRIALAFDGDTIASQGILSSVVRDVRAAGWQVVYDQPRARASQNDLVAFTFDTGVTYLARGTVLSSVGRYQDLQNATVTLDVVLLDTRTMHVVHTFNQTATAVGPSHAAALQAAGQMLGTDLARSWNQVFLRPEDRRSSVFTFRNVNRPGTRFTLQEVVERIATVLEVRNVTYDAQRREVRMDVVVAGDPCQVAREVPNHRRVYTTLEQCDGGSASFSVSGD